MSSIVDQLDKIRRAGERSDVLHKRMLIGALRERMLIIDEFTRLHLNRDLLPREKWVKLAQFLNQRSEPHECSEIQNTDMAGRSTGSADLNTDGAMGTLKPKARARYNRRRSR